MNKKLGDRKDGTLIRDLDPMHFITPLIYPNRCDNEAYVYEHIDLTAINNYLAKKNQGNPEFPLTLFHLIVTAMGKTIILRPKLNRFIANKNFYQRNKVTASFVVKKKFNDEAKEALAILEFEDNDTVDTIHQKLYQQITACRSDSLDVSSNSMDIFNRMPRFLSKFLVWIITILDKHGLCPNFLIASDPYYSSVVLSNVGSIKMKSGYHHLTNWGTCSMFCLIGEKKRRPMFDEHGNVTMIESVDLGLTIDERLADGYYYSKSIQLLKKILENPELLEMSMKEEVNVNG